MQPNDLEQTVAPDVAVSPPPDMPATPPSGTAQGKPRPPRFGLRLANLPRSCVGVQHAVETFRNRVEAAIAAAGRTLDLPAADAVNAACTAEQRRLLLQRRLRLDDSVPLAEYRATLADIAAAVTARSKAIERLKLDAEPDVWASFYASAPPPNAIAAPPACVQPSTRLNGHPDALDAEEHAL